MPAPPMLAPPALCRLVCWAWLAGLPLAGRAQPAADASGRAPYVLLRGAVAGVEGDLGTTYDDPGSGLGIEAGLRFDRRWSVAVGLWAQHLPSLIEGYWYDRGGPRNVQGSRAHQVQGLIRLHLPGPWERRELLAPYVEAGLAVVAGQGTEEERNRRGGAGRTVWGVGPTLGLGADVALSPRFALRAGLQSTIVLPDAALDGADPSAFASEPAPPPGALADRIGYDILTNVGVGIRYTLAASRGVPPAPPVAAPRADAPTSPPAAPSPATPPRAPTVEPPTVEPPTVEPPTVEPPTVEPKLAPLACPDTLTVGAPGAFQADVSPPGAVTWRWGDGGYGAGGDSGTHAYDAPGVYTATATIETDCGTASGSCEVTVVASPVPPTLTSCTASPATAAVGKGVLVDATATDADSVTVAFGDGSVIAGLPARHEYAQAGTYTITVSASNFFGHASCEAPVTVDDPLCAATPSSIRFKSGASDLTAGAMRSLDDAAALLDRCPALCLRLDGYGAESGGDPAALAQRRADTALFYLVGQGIDADRLRAVGGGAPPPDAPPAGQVAVHPSPCVQR